MVVSMERWVGKVAVVTGTSSGIGAATAEALVRQGVVVAGLDINPEPTEQLAKKLSDQKGKLHSFKCDMSKEEDILKTFKYIKDNLGPIHILVNNAGIIILQTLHDGDTEKWKKVLDVNVLGVCIATREAIRDMRANNVNGHIIHINSHGGHHVNSFPNLNVYFASKFAITALTETLRLELNSIQSKIKITGISPGSIRTGMLKQIGSSPVSTGRDFESGPFAEPEDIADGILYVLSTPPHVQVHELMIKPVNDVY